MAQHYFNRSICTTIKHTSNFQSNNIMPLRDSVDSEPRGLTGTLTGHWQAHTASSTLRAGVESAIFQVTRTTAQACRRPSETLGRRLCDGGILKHRWFFDSGARRCNCVLIFSGAEYRGLALPLSKLASHIPSDSDSDRDSGRSDRDSEASSMQLEGPGSRT